ncbi:MAG TPA: HypC/HybG/HupF family hydrogenase formation chaperone [Phycisphaerae bacterium]|nr:HypC/HybG/HupF family hydrogenase formation chaperone [Phycisphaerae bacterium]
MCLAVPGKIVEIKPSSDAALGSVGVVDFQGTRLEVGLTFVPEAVQGDWVLVHAGFALNVLDEQEARETWQYLKEADIVVDLPGEMGGGAKTG